MGLRSGGLLLLGVVGVLGLRLDLSLHGVAGDGDEEQAGTEVDNKSILIFLQGDCSGARFSLSGLPNLKMSTWLGLLAEGEGVMDSLMLDPSNVATMSFTVVPVYSFMLVLPNKYSLAVVLLSPRKTD